MMTRDNQMRKQLSNRCIDAIFALSIACLSFIPTATALIINPRQALLSNNRFKASSFLTTHLTTTRTDTKLKTTRDNNADSDDFAAFDAYQRQEDEGQKLAKEFYQELELRQRSESLLSDNPASDVNPDETYMVVRSTDQTKSGNPQNKIRTVRIRAASADGKSPTSPTRFTNQPTKASAQDSTTFTFPLLPFLSFPAPAPRPATSAGLFSGSGTTVYSSGRSIRAEIEILESTIKNNEANNKSSNQFYVGSPEQMEEILKLVALSLIAASATYIAIEVSGVHTIISWDGNAFFDGALDGATASAQHLVSLMNEGKILDGAIDGATSSAQHLMSLMNDATKDGMSSIMVSVGHGDVMLGEEAAWLMKESSELAASVVEAVRSVEELVLS